MLALVAGAQPSPRKPKPALFRGEVVRFDSAAIVVRDRKNPVVIRTFTYSPALRKKVEKQLETGGYPYGERVKIRYEPGTRVALRISGKPPKPIRRPRRRK